MKRFTDGTCRDGFFVQDSSRRIDAVGRLPLRRRQWSRWASNATFDPPCLPQSHDMNTSFLSGAPFNLDARAIAWVETTYRTLNLQDRVGQLFNLLSRG